MLGVLDLVLPWKKRTSLSWLRTYTHHYFPMRSIHLVLNLVFNLAYSLIILIYLFRLTSLKILSKPAYYTSSCCIFLLDVWQNTWSHTLILSKVTTLGTDLSINLLIYLSTWTRLHNILFINKSSLSIQILS